MHELNFTVIVANCLSLPRYLAEEEQFYRCLQRWSKSIIRLAIQPASACTVGSQTSYTCRIPCLALVFLWLCFVADEIPLFSSHQDVLPFSTGLLKDPGSDAWVKVLSSLDCKYSFEPQAIPCSITWRRNMPNTLSTPVSTSHLLCTCKLATDVLWGESFDLPL